jgi:aspartyl-tRNA synthetase
MLKSHSCGELNKDDIGRRVKLAGWVYRRRDHGKIIFIDIRDREGITQLVFVPSILKENFKEAQNLNKEDVILIEGKVQKRPEGTENDKIKTGEIEILIDKLEILNKSLPLPFELESETEVGEELRLKYRFLDLRKPELQKNFILRHKAIKSIRDFLDKKGFLEIETPILTKSTPEGARDFLVPSRLSPGSFYALPQSPQLFKQILIIAGFEKYFQIARCFRDEDLRADRQPEFTQLDLEMAFIEEEDIFKIIEELVKYIFSESLGIKLNIPFPKFSYKDIMEKYDIDKPDLRKEFNTEFAFLWVKDFPLFSYNKELGIWEMEHHPFTSPKEEDIKFLETEPQKVRACSYDLVLNGVELGSGSIRIHQKILQEKIFSFLGLKKEDIEEKFGFLLRALEYGAPPHGGFAIGIDRLIAMMMHQDTIRDVIAFPKTQKGICLLTSAPSEVNPMQLYELDIKVIKKESDEHPIR